MVASGSKYFYLVGCCLVLLFITIWQFYLLHYYGIYGSIPLNGLHEKLPTSGPRFEHESTGLHNEISAVYNDTEGHDGPTKDEPPIKPAYPRGILINTPGCKIPKYRPWDHSLEGLVQAGVLPVCNSSDLVYKEGYYIRLNTTLLKSLGQSIVCYACPFDRHDDDNLIIRNPVVFDYGYASEKFYGARLGSDCVLFKEHIQIKKWQYVSTECHVMHPRDLGENSFQPIEYRNTFIFPLGPNFSKTKQNVASKPVKNQLNVMVLGVDSMSRLNFMRQYSKTREFLLGELDGIEMLGYTKVGDNTFFNLTPLMTGFHPKELMWEKQQEGFNKAVDHWPFLWKQYSKAGYKTLFAEDYPGVSTWNFIYGTFDQPPTDYYYRPAALHMEYNEDKWKQRHCYGSRLEAQILLDYVQDFLKLPEQEPHFIFTFLTRLSPHSGFKYDADLLYERFLKSVHRQGLLNNTVLLMLSDHGNRGGKLHRTIMGKLENRLPLLVLSFPKWFHKKYPKIIKNVRHNRDRLTSPFDVHKTLLQLVNFPKPVTLSKKRGRSLMDPISDSRTCSHAGIPLEWCPCGEFKPVRVPVMFERNIAKLVENELNHQLAPVKDKCHKVSVHKITEVLLGKQQNVTQNGTDITSQSLLVTVEMTPGHALLACTIIHYLNKGVINMLPDVSRLNLYGNTSSCIHQPRLRLTCFCKSNPAWMH